MPDTMTLGMFVENSLAVGQTLYVPDLLSYFSALLSQIIVGTT